MKAKKKKEVKIRRTWGFVPTARVVPSKKEYSRKKKDWKAE